VHRPSATCCSDHFAILVTTRATVRERAGPGLRLACGRTRRHFRRKGEDLQARTTRGWIGSARMAASICLHPPGPTDSAAHKRAAYTHYPLRLIHIIRVLHDKMDPGWHS
jgi:hypothetical protein